MLPFTYTNPVHPDYFADPFVLKLGREYWAYGTAPQNPSDRGQFPVLHSTDLVHWRHVGHALVPLRDPAAFAYWAPEVAHDEPTRRFVMYYSASTSRSDEHHRLRAAVADSPAGPFVDSGKLLLPNESFSIDAHPFRDPRSGRWFLFFAKDFLDDEPHGTGLAVAPLADDLLTITEPPRMVLRASCAWQVYQRDRAYRGRRWPAWHCVEGPFVVYRDGRYWLLYSGGAWHTQNYGLGFAVADSPLGPWRDDFAAHGPTVLQGVAGHVIGPGHNSVVIGPDDQTMFVVYHAWDAAHTARRMCIDPLRWTPERPRCEGPSVGPKTVELMR
jgi:beta-xylosidase